MLVRNTGVGRWAALLAVLAGALVAVVPAAQPAAAAGCGPIRDPRTGRVVAWDCPPYQELRVSPDPPCRCPFDVDLRIGPVLPEESLVAVHEAIQDGIGLLVVAQGDAALERFGHAAAKLGPAEVSMSTVVEVDEKGYLRPIPQPPYPIWFFGERMADGLGLLRAALADPDNAAEYRKAALDDFAAAVAAAGQVG
jgi:hypothetical protein